MLDTLPYPIKRRLLSAVQAVQKKLVEDGGEDLFFYTCVEVNRFLGNAACVEVNCFLRNANGDYENGETFREWAKSWMDENLITPELLRVLDYCDVQRTIDYEEGSCGILAYHPATHVTNRDDVPKEWAYNARMKMLSEAAELLKCEA